VFALIPNAPNFQTWAVRLVGLWLTAYILWFCGFLGVLFLGRFLGGATIVGGKGLRLWRFGRWIPWDSIKAVGVEQQDLFARVFCLSPPVYRLTLFTKRSRSSLTPVNVPSFLFLKADFKALVSYVLKETRLGAAALLPFLLFNPNEIDDLKKSYRRSEKLRLLFVAFIVPGLVMFLGRKSITSYEFNLGNKAFRVENYAEARLHFERSVSTDPAFAVGWDRLARSEHRLGDNRNAEEHWHKALAYRPDFVDSKIGLAKLFIENGEYDKAKSLLEQSVRLSPHNTAAYLNLSRIALHAGNRQQALSLLQSAITEGNPDATSFAACARLSAELGMQQQAVKLAQQALKWDPANVDAKSVLKSFEGMNK
jgi:Tfp pilus assembly protein PilF